MDRVGPDLVRAPALVAERGCALGRPMHLLTTTTSTNDEAKRGAQSGAPHGATWVTEEQSAGRGRQGRAWEAARGENLLFSVLLRLDCPPARLPLVSLLAGLVVREALAKASPNAEVSVKWPNDVVAQARRAGQAGQARGEGAPQTLKLSGVLVEAITSGSSVQAVVVGIGINVHSRHFPESIAARATSVALLQTQGSPPPDRAEILADVLFGLDRDLHVVIARGLGMVRARVEAADMLRGQSVRGGGADAHREGVAAGIDDEGRLVVRLRSGDIVRWNAGEVHLSGS